jgi:hypothetical protein
LKPFIDLVPVQDLIRMLDEGGPLKKISGTAEEKAQRRLTRMATRPNMSKVTGILASLTDGIETSASHREMMS